jgi:2-polyprenyl-3-methyl-5-hydroxy-6-metoxy-1,4-benzoquinol methylase
MPRVDPDERRILSAFNSGKLNSVASKVELDQLRDAAKATLVTSFYDDLAPLYHLVHQDWEASIARQGEQLGTLIASHWPGRRKLLDVTCGIGTQAIALALKGFDVTASDLSAQEIARARQEASKRGLQIPLSVCDVRQAHAHHGTGFDVVLSCDNSLAHLLTDDDMLLALQQMRECLAPGGGCIVSVRDYALEQRGTNLLKPYGVRIEDGRRWLLFQVWDFDGDGERYDLAFFFVEEDLASRAVTTHVMRSRCYAIATDRLIGLMRQAGFSDVRRLDGVFYQPVLAGTRAA